MNPLRSVGARLSLALVAVVALALVLVYADRRSRRFARVSSTRSSTAGEGAADGRRGDPADGRQFELGRQSRALVRPRGCARRRLHDPERGERRSPVAASLSYRGLERPDVARRRANDAIAQSRRPTRASRRSGHGQARRRRVRRGRAAGRSSNYVALLSALAAAIRSRTSTRCSAGCRGRRPRAAARARRRATALAFLFARRIRRLEAAAERIAAGNFDEPVVDRSPDELGQLARAFDRMRLRLSQLERARREFIGNASHELRTPLFSLRGFIELLTDEELDEATRRGVPRDDARAGRPPPAAGGGSARPDASRRRADAHRAAAPSTSREVAQDLYEEFRAVAVATSHPLELETRRRATALGDEGRVLRIGRALVENALMHTPAGTRVRRAVGRKLAHRVATRARASRREHAGHIFDRFYRVDGAQASGSGLGLAIAHELGRGDGRDARARVGAGRDVVHAPAAGRASDESAAVSTGKRIPARISRTGVGLIRGATGRTVPRRQTENPALIGVRYVQV